MPLFERILIAGVALLWGANFIVIKWGLEDVDPYAMTALRFFFIVIPAIFFVSRPSVPLKVVALYGLLFGGGLWGLVNLAVFLGTPAGSASLLLQLSAFFSIVAALIFFNEPVSRLKVIGIGLAFAGFVMVTVFRNENVPLIGIIIMFVAAVSWTICNMLIKKAKPSNVPSFIIWSSLFVPIPVLLIPFFQVYNSSAPEEFFNLFAISGIKGWVSILFQSFLTTLVGYGLWTRAITRYGLINVAPYSLLVPISGLFCGWVFYNEVMTRIEIIGAILILLGLVLLSVNIHQNINLMKNRYSRS